MDHPFTASKAGVEALDDIHLSRLLKLLLHLEARKAGIAGRHVDVPLEINVPDGGEDGRVSWPSEPPCTDYIPSRLTQFQIKASDLSPAACACELLDSDGNIKPAINDCLSQGGHYVLFANRGWNKQMRDRRLDRMHDQLRQCGALYAETAELHVYDSNKIHGWVNEYLPAIAYVLGCVGKPLVPGMLSWDEWSRTAAHRNPAFVADNLRVETIANIRDTLSEPQTAFRVVGLAGLGKTRLALEATKPNDTDPGLTELVVYIDAAHGPSNLPGHVADWVRLQYRGLIVVDNCDLSLHRALLTQVQRGDSNLSLLSLDYDLSHDGRTPTAQLEPLSQADTEKLITDRYDGLIPDPNRLAQFSEGFPQLAILLADGRHSDESPGATLSDDELLKRLVWGKEKSDDEALACLQACAVFDTLGVTGSARAELEFAAEFFAEVPTERLYRVITRFSKRGIIDWRGRYVRVVPLPLAVRLAGGWWEATSPEIAKDLIARPMPERLASSLATRFAVLDQVPEVRTLSTQLCAPGGPLSTKDTALSPQGIKLVRSLVGLDPEATGRALERVLSPLGHDQLLGITGSIRGDLVASLERLAFHNSQFTLAAGMLLRLGAAETENYSNNATGQFLQLFSTFLSGTQAPPAVRIEFLVSCLRNS